MKERAKLCDRLQEALTARGMKAADLSELTGVPKGAISYYLADKSRPKAPRTYILAKALDVNEAWLMGYDVAMDRTPEQKKNDRSAQLIGRMRRDPEFYNIVEMLDRVPLEQLDNLRGLVAGLVKK